jgi:hypothetical protein
MTTAAKQTIHSGHTINIRVKGKIIGRIQGLDGERNFGAEPVYEIGSIMPQEIVNNRYEGTINCERFFVRNSDLADLDMASVGEEILKKDMITIEVVDKYTGKIVRSYHGCTCSTYRETFRVNSIAGENATWMYLYAK